TVHRCTTGMAGRYPSRTAVSIVRGGRRPDRHRSPAGTSVGLMTSDVARVARCAWSRRRAGVVATTGRARAQTRAVARARALATACEPATKDPAGTTPARPGSSGAGQQVAEAQLGQVAVGEGDGVELVALVR